MSQGRSRMSRGDQTVQKVGSQPASHPVALAGEGEGEAEVLVGRRRLWARRAVLSKPLLRDGYV